MNTEVIKLNLDMTPSMKAMIDKIAAESGLGLAEVLRRAVILVDAVQEAKGRGESLVFIDKDDKIVTNVIGLGHE